jgi:dTDP-4-amino-4,6-dideoxygalactose transaminase
MTENQRLPLVDLAKQYANLRTELVAATDRVFGSLDFVQGSETGAFEREFADFCEVTHAVACGNGTDALELALAATGVKAGDEVITVAHTFAATAEAIVRVGAVPRFVDVDPASLVMDVGLVAKAINKRTAAVIPVHLYGNCVDMNALMSLAHEHGLKVIEDAAQAHGAIVGGRRAGTIGDAGCFSFYPSKNLGAYGDAGAVVTKSGEIAACVRKLRDHGRTGKYKHEVIGRNSRMDSLQAAFLRVKLHHLDDWNQRRRDLATRYRFLLEDVPEVEVVQAPSSADSIYHLFVIQIDDRDAVRERLTESGIGAGVHYPIPVHLQPAFARVGELSQGTLPVTERAAKRVLSLPMFPEMEDPDVDWVVRELGQSLTV